MSPAPRQITGRSEPGSAWPRDRVHQLGRVEQEVLASKLRSSLTAEQYGRIVIDIAESRNERARRRLAARRRALLNDDWKELLIADIKNRTTQELWTVLMGPNGEYADITRNPAKDIWAENAVLYKSAATRSTPDAPAEIDKYRRLTRRFFHSFWQRVEVDLGGMNDVLIWPTVGERHGKRVLRHNVAAGDTVTVTFDEELGGSEPFAVLFIDHMRDYQGRAAKRYRIWTPDWRLMFDEQKRRLDHITGIVVGDGADGWENPYGILPFECIHASPYQPWFWDQTTGEDLVSLTLKTGRFETDTDYKAFRAGHKQLVASGNRVQVPDKTLLDPGAVIKLIGDAINVQLIDWQLNLKDRLEAVNGWEIRAAASRGINPERLRRTGYQTAMGARLSERGLQERRERMEEIFRDAEAGYYHLVARIARLEQLPGPLPDPDVELEVTHAPMDYPEDPERRLRVAEEKMRMGLKSLVSFVQEDHPSWGEEKSLAFIEKNLQLLSRIQAIKQQAGVPDNDLANRSAADEAAGATGPEIRDA